MKQSFFLKLIPPRASFAQDMTDSERQIMMRHVEYWRSLMDTGVVIVYGPVLDPAGAYGVGIIEVESEDNVKEIISKDPAIEVNRYEYWPMRAVRPQQTPI